MNVTEKLDQSRAVRAFRGTPAEFRATFGDTFARRCTYTLAHSGFMGLETSYRYSLHADSSLATKAADDKTRRRVVPI